MAVLKIWKNGISEIATFDPPCRLDKILEHQEMGIVHPCGGRGNCGKCVVEITGLISEPNQTEITAGVRLSCQIQLFGDAEVRLPGDCTIEEIEVSGHCQVSRLNPMQGNCGVAVDIGTTTLALRLFDLRNGKCLSTCSMENPQRNLAADVMGRIQAALSGESENLQRLIRNAIDRMLNKVSKEAGCSRENIDIAVVTGNTTMLYLLLGHNVAPLAAAPFKADRLFDEHQDFLGLPTYFPPCISAFVGADVSCAVLSSGMCRSDEIALLCDIGTNGEIALWKDGKLYVTSTAAGPAFEGAGISCGCGSIKGAIDKVWTKDGKLCVHTIGNAQSVGLCGSGLIDTIAAGLELEQIDESGALESEAFTISEKVKLLQKDIRAVQLAKAAIAAGIETVLLAASVPVDAIGKLYIAGGFGSHLNIASAVQIGLIPRMLSEKVIVLGNAALTGAGRLLLDRSYFEEIRRIVSASVHINLGGNAVFGEKFIERMFFEEI